MSLAFIEQLSSALAAAFHWARLLQLLLTDDE